MLWYEQSIPHLVRQLLRGDIRGGSACLDLPSFHAGLQMRLCPQIRCLTLPFGARIDSAVNQRRGPNGSAQAFNLANSPYRTVRDSELSTYLGRPLECNEYGRQYPLDRNSQF